nr:hypothetical protein Iba_scaffold3818CG0060 [Ipomoea batatas]
MNLGCTRKTRKEVRAAKRAAATSRTPPAQPPAPSPSSSSQPASSHRQILSSPSTQPQSPPILSPDDSIFFESAAPSAEDPTPASSSSSLLAVPKCFIKVTDRKSMQAFHYQLHLEHEQRLQEMETRHLELLEELSMQMNHLRRELAKRGPNTRQ